MPYPDNVLATDEQVVLHRHPHWKRLLAPILILLAATAVAAFSAAFVGSLDWATNAKKLGYAVDQRPAPDCHWRPSR